MRKFALLTVLLLLAITLAITSCGETEGSNGGNGGSYSTPDVTMSQMAFDHNHLTISAGTAVKFIDAQGAAPHILCIGANATCDKSTNGPHELSGGNSLKVDPGETKTVTFDTPGAYAITCTLHPMMNLTITVQ